MAKTVLAFGSFDVLHPGHIHYLAAARGLGDRLVVVVSRDESIRLIKHREPLFDQGARARIIGSLKMVDMAVVGERLRSPADRYNIFKKYRPDVIALGYDQDVDIRELKTWLKENRIDAKVVRLRARLSDDVYKSSKFISRLALAANTADPAQKSQRRATT